LKARVADESYEIGRADKYKRERCKIDKKRKARENVPVDDVNNRNNVKKSMISRNDYNEMVLRNIVDQTTDDESVGDFGRKLCTTPFVYRRFECRTITTTASGNEVADLLAKSPPPSISAILFSLQSPEPISVLYCENPRNLYVAKQLVQSSS